MDIQDFKQSLDYLTKAELTPFIWGHAGIGKSMAVKQWATDKGYKFFPFYLGTQSDTGDILGLARRRRLGDHIVTDFAIPMWLQETIDYCVTNPESGAVIFLDEFNRGRRDLLNGMFSLALDKTFHTMKLPKNCYIIAAGNPPTDEYFTTDVEETALMSRFVHIKLEPTISEWIEYAKTKKLEPSLVAFIQTQPQLLDEKHSEFTLPVKPDRRAFERAASLFAVHTPQHLLEQLMYGILGIERTVAYLEFLKNQDKPLSGQEVFRGEKFDLIKKWNNDVDVIASCINVTCDNVKAEILLRNEPNKGLKRQDKAVAVLTKEEKVNFMTFIGLLPKDIAFAFVTWMVKSMTHIMIDFYCDSSYEEILSKIIIDGRKTI